MDKTLKMSDASAQNLEKNLSAANLAIEAAEDKFSLLVDSVKDYAIFLMDVNGYIQSWNKGAERIKGYKAREIIGKHFSIFYTQKDIQRNHPQNELRLALLNGKYEEEGWRIRKNGTTFWANVTITPMKDQNGIHVGFAKVTRDLSERKEAEEKLKLSEERHRRMFEGIKDYAMIMLDENGKVTSWNEGARRINGYEASEIIGKYFSIFYDPQDINMGKCEYELKEAAETGRFEDEGWRLRKDGTKFWASVLLTSIRNDEGKVIGFSKVTRDITDKKRANDLLKMAYNDLEKRVEERTNELMKANKDLQEAIQTRDEFLSIASHELRTPLTPLKLQIQTFISSVQKKTIQKMTEEKLERMAENCDRAISRLSALVDNLLDVSRINSGRLTLNFEEVDLTEIAEDLMQRYSPEMERTETIVTLNYDRPVIGMFDKLRFEQVIQNLLMNALKYGNRNPVYIEINEEPGYAVLTVSDKGIGIKEIDKERIFKRFERVDSSVNVGGLGLGLYITKQIVDSHNGSIEVESSMGKGTTFRVKLPLNQITH